MKKPGIIVKLSKDISINKFVYIMFFPVLLFYVVFHYIPMGGIVVAFQDYRPFKGILGSAWIGLGNFIDFLTGPYAWRTIRNTFVINIYQIIFAFPAPIILALLLNEMRAIRFKKVVQTISYMPHFISLVVICGMITDFSTMNGLFNKIIVMFGGKATSLLTRSELFRTIFVASDIWQGIGWGSIIYLATLSGVDMNLYEAAVIDGAGRFRQALHITLPSLIPTITTLLIMRMGRIMSLGFGKIILLYNPLTYETADVVSSFVYRRGLVEQNYGLGAAVGLFNSVINIATLIIANKLSKKITNESLW
ncbi:MAG: ABC transporter permease subunit [Treponema sp.]|nr:ABC transporter permease subunit [Treponema sp.]